MTIECWSQQTLESETGSQLFSHKMDGAGWRPDRTQIFSANFKPPILISGWMNGEISSFEGGCTGFPRRPTWSFFVGGLK
jgi:hypothetical protein